MVAEMDARSPRGDFADLAKGHIATGAVHNAGPLLLSWIAKRYQHVQLSFPRQPSNSLVHALCALLGAREAAPNLARALDRAAADFYFWHSVGGSAGAARTDFRQIRRKPKRQY